MRKKILCVLTVFFYAGMLLATFFHQKVDGLFREKVQIAQIEVFCEEYRENIEVNGIQTEVIKRETFFLLPRQAVKDDKIYVVETVQVPYGSYEMVRLRHVQIAGEMGDRVKVEEGLSETDRVAETFKDTLCDGMRVVIDEK